MLLQWWLALRPIYSSMASMYICKMYCGRKSNMIYIHIRVFKWLNYIYFPSLIFGIRYKKFGYIHDNRDKFRFQ
jgi:hypothetical protein